MHDARDGGPVHLISRGIKGPKGGGPALASYRACNGVRGARYVSFPLEPFEQAVLCRLREVDPREVLPGGADDAASAVLALAGRLAETEGRIEAVKAQLLAGGDLAPLVDVLRSLEAKRVAEAGELAAARREAASPLASAWGECRSLLDALARAPDPDEARVRLRAVLRRVVAGVWCLFVNRGTKRLAAVRVQFSGGAHRDYLVLHTPALGGSAGRQVTGRAGGVRPARTEVRSFASAGAPGEFDLRDPAQAAKLRAALESARLPS